MRTVALLAFTTLALLGAGGDSHAQSEAWCANYSDQSTDCGFATFEQCEADIQGVGGFCSRNPESD